MENRTISIKEEDTPIFDKIQKLGDDILSGLIINCLRQYIEVEDIKASVFHEIIIPVSVSHLSIEELSKVRFKGKFLTELNITRQPLKNPNSWEHVYNVYLTPKGKLLVYYKEIVSILLDTPENEKSVTHSYKVYDSFNDLSKADVPVQLVSNVAQKLGLDTIEALDV